MAHGSVRHHMSPVFWVRVRMLVAGAMVSWACSAAADTRPPVVVIMPPPRPSSPPPAAFSAQPALQWAPRPAVGLTPGVRSPTPLCYADAHVCPLAQPEHVGESCICGAVPGGTVGRALIPPSHDVAGRPSGSTDPCCRRKIEMSPARKVEMTAPAADSLVRNGMSAKR
jgi:hypothetical protein